MGFELKMPGNHPRFRRAVVRSSA